jgi:hypothetical protein
MNQDNPMISKTILLCNNLMKIQNEHCGVDFKAFSSHKNVLSP